MELFLCVSNSFIVCFIIFTVEYSDFSVPFLLVPTYLKTQADLTVFKLIRPSRVVRWVGYYSWSRGKETQPIFIFSHVAIFICNNNYLFYLFNIYIYNIYLYLYLFIFIIIYIIIIYLFYNYLFIFIYLYLFNIYFLSCCACDALRLTVLYLMISRLN